MTEHRFYVAFPIEDGIRERAQDAIDLLRDSDNKQDDAGDFVDSVEEISSAGLVYFFLNPIKAVGLGPVAFKTVEVTLTTAQRAVMTVARKLVRSMNDDQIVGIATFVESLIYDFDIQDDDEVDEEEEIESEENEETED